MKFYVAGLSFHNKNSRHRDKLQFVLQSLPDIVLEAETFFDKDVIILIVMHEYGLTAGAISNQEKKECLKALVEIVKQYPNVLLIPGSFPAYEKISDLKNKSEKIYKIHTNYQQLESCKRYTKWFDFFYQIERFKMVDRKKNLDSDVCLQNSTYIICKEQQKIKHKKCMPWYEASKLIDIGLSPGHVFDIGVDDPVKKIKVGDYEFDLGIIICAEYCYLELPNDPLLEVIISDSIRLDFQKKQKNFAALLIHMDSRLGLNIYINEEHPKRCEIKEVKTKHYVLDEPLMPKCNRQ